MAQRLSAAGPNAPILLREDAGFDSAAQMRATESYNQPGRLTEHGRRLILGLGANDPV
jgi:hypothetical protein